MADKRISELPLATGPISAVPSDVLPIDGSTTRKVPLSVIGDVIVPVSSQAEAEAGTNNTKRMTPLTTKQSIASEVGVSLASSSQGSLADTALQPGEAATPTELADATTFVQDITGAVSRPAVLKLRDGPITLEDAGYVSGSALPALNKLLANGERIQLGPKIYEIDATPNSVIDTPVSISGTFGQSILRFSDGSSGLNISQDTYLFATCIDNLILETNDEEPGTALNVEYSSSDSINNRWQNRCIIRDVEARGVDRLTSGWGKGIRILDVYGAKIIRPTVSGRVDLSLSGSARFKLMTAGVEVEGSDPTFTAIPGNILIDSPSIYHSSYALYSHGEVEGVFVSNPVAVAVDKGVYSNQSTLRPLLSVRGGHLEVFSFGVDAVKTPEMIVDGVEIYKSPLSDNDTYAIAASECHESLFDNLSFINQNGGTANPPPSGNGQFNGILLTDCSSCIIGENIRHRAPSKSIILAGTTDNTKSSEPYTYGSITGAIVQKYDDTSSGIANKYSGSGRNVGNVQNASTVTATSGGATAVSIGPINANKGERYQVEGFVQSNKGGVAGEMLTTLSKSGTATATFAGGRSSLLTRTAQAAGASVAHPVNGVLYVTASGTLTVSLIAQSTGSDASVVAGDAQLTMTLL